MIRFGMALMEMVQQLTKGFVKATGRQPDNLEKLKIQQEAVQRFKDMNKVVDMEGNVIDTSKGIMGGKQIQENKEFGKALKEELMKTDNPFSDLVKTTEKGPKTLAQREAEVLAKMEKENKEAVDRIRKRKQKELDDYEDDLPMAQGGRAGFKDGMDRRTFMKIMGGLATLPIVGKFAKGAKLAAPAVKKVAEITAPALDKIIETVMSAGKLVSQSGRRLKELTTKKKLKDIEVEEDMMDGPSYTIKTKDKTIYYKPGKQDEMGFDDDIIEVIEDTVTKKAGGGIARMLGE